MTGDRADEARDWLLSAIARGERWSSAMPPDLNATTVALTAEPESVKEARELTRSTLRRWGLSPMYDDIGLVVSELVTNALRHAVNCDQDDKPIRFSLLRTGNQITCAVTDPSDEVPVAREPDFASQTGRGLHLVEAFSQSWSWAPLSGHGKVVWAIFLT